MHRYKVKKNMENNRKLRKKHLNIPAQNHKTKSKSTQKQKQIKLKQKTFEAKDFRNCTTNWLC